MKCPCCNGTGEITPNAPIHLTPMQFRIWDIVRRCKDGIELSSLVTRLYAHYPDGGPVCAMESFWVQRRLLNRRLATVNQRVTSTKGHGSIYWLEHLK